MKKHMEVDDIEKSVIEKICTKCNINKPLDSFNDKLVRFGRWGDGYN